MNNINQKNEIIRQKRYSGIPYKYAENINYGYSQNINSTIFNNTTQQLLDNDLYVENSIRDYATSQVGPKSPDSDTIYNAYDGYKVLSDDGTNFFVYRKEEEEFGSKISCVMEVGDVNFSFVFKGTLFIGTKTSLQYVDINNNFIELIQYGTYDYDIQENYVFFATDAGVYVLRSSGEFSIEQNHEIEQVDNSFDKQARSVWYDIQTQTLFAGTTQSIYEGKINLSKRDLTFIDFSFEYVPMKTPYGTYDIKTQVNKFSKKDDKVVAITNFGAYKQNTQQEYKNYRTILEGMECRLYEKWNEQNYFVASDGNSDGVYVCGQNYGNVTKLSSFSGITCMEGQRSLYIGSDSGLIRYDGNQFYRYSLQFPQIVDIALFDINGTDQIIVATEDSLYHVGNQYEQILLERFDDQTIRNVLIYGDRLYVGTSNSMYVYFLKKERVQRQTSRMNGFQEVRGALIPEVSSIIGKVDGHQNQIVYTDSIVYDFSVKGGSFFREDTGKQIIKVIKIRNFLVVVRKDGLRLLNGDPSSDEYMTVETIPIFGAISNETIADAVATNNLIVVRTQGGNVYRYQIRQQYASDYSNPIKFDVGNYFVESIASYDTMVGIKIRDSQNTMLYYRESQLPEKIRDSSDFINKIRYDESQDLVYASTKNGLILSSESIFEFAGEPCVLDEDVESRDSIVLNGKLYNCTDDGVKRYVLKTENGVVVGAEPDENSEFLTGKRINGAIEYEGTVIVAGDGGVHTLSGIATLEDVSQTIQQISSNICQETEQETEPPRFVGRFSKIQENHESGESQQKNYIVVMTRNGVYVQEEGLGVSVCETYPWDFDLNDENEIVQINDVIYLEDGNRKEYCIATSGGFAVFDVSGNTFRLNCFKKTEDDQEVLAKNVKSLIKNGSDIILVYENLSFSSIKKYVGDETIYDIDGTNLDQFHTCLGSAKIGDRIFILGQESSGLKKIVVCEIQQDGGIGECTEVIVRRNSAEMDMTYMQTIFQDNGIFYAIVGGKICWFSLGLQNRIIFEGEITDENIQERIVCDGQAIFKKESGEIISLFNKEENILLLEENTKAIIFEDKLQYGKDSKFSFITFENETRTLKFIESGNVTEEFVDLGEDEDRTYVSYFGKQFGVVLIITPDINNYVRKQRPSSIYDISRLDGAHYTNLFKTRLGIDFGFSYLEQKNTAYVFGKTVVYSWGANSSESLIENANLYQYKNVTGIDADIKQIIYISGEQKSLTDVLGIGNENFGIMYVTNRGIYSQSISNNDISMFRLDYKDTGVGGVLQTTNGIIFQKIATPFNLMINQDGAKSNELIVGNIGELPSGIQKISQVGENKLLRKSSGKWFYYINGTKFEIQNDDIKGFFDNVTIPHRGIAETDIAFSPSKILKISYETVYSCSLMDKIMLVQDIDVASRHTMKNNICFVVQKNSEKQVVDETGHAIRFEIGGQMSYQFDDIIPIDGSDGWYFILDKYDLKQYFVMDKTVVPLQVHLEPMSFSQRNGKDIISLSQTIVEIFQEYGDVDVFEQVDRNNLEMTDILKINDKNFILCTRDGFYRYAEDSIYKISDTKNAKSIVYHEFDEYGKFICGCGNIVMWSKNGKKWQNMFQIYVSDAAINEIYVKNRMEYFISTTKGLYKTIYSYRLVNDYDNRNEFEMRSFVQGLSAELESTYQTNMDKHIKDYHAPDTDIEKINNTTLSVNMESPSKDWCRIQDGDEYIIENDMVYSMDFGDSQTGVLRVDIDNYLGQVFNVASEYIQKNYMGGVTELFIHVDTTNNYYLNFMDGTPNCTSEQASEKRTRRNLETSQFISKNLRDQNSSVSEHCTTITVTLNGQVFDVQHVLGMEINGCSLPLKIYKDTISPINQNANNMFGGLIVPSVAKNYQINPGGDHTFTFCCFGTDEQSIKITFLGNSQSTPGKFVTIKFDSNGGSGTTPSQKVLLDTSTTLRANLFTRKDYEFSGWSFYIPGINQKPTFKDKDNITFDSKIYVENSTVTLYAVWRTQEQPGSGGGGDETISDGSEILLNTQKDEQIAIVYTEDGETVFQVTDA